MTPEAISWNDDGLRLLDQRLLPHEVRYLEVQTISDGWHAIRDMAVRGAPAIGIAAAYTLALAMRDQRGSPDEFRRVLTDQAAFLGSARPTAVNLAWAIRRLCERAVAEPCYEALVEEAASIHAEDRAICRAIGQHGSALIRPGYGVLTHCNAGALAVSELGTATAPIYLNHARGVKFQVYVDETRPLLQGARLTAWELDRAGVDVTLICDNAAASLMAAGSIDLVLVGTDRVARNGDVVNKIGTLNLAVLCRHFHVPFYVACPSSTYDAGTASGGDVTIEERPASEVLGDAAARVDARNPAFDVTPAALVSGIITEHGIARAPLADSLARLLTASGNR